MEQSMLAYALNDMKSNGRPYSTLGVLPKGMKGNILKSSALQSFFASEEQVLVPWAVQLQALRTIQDVWLAALWPTMWRRTILLASGTYHLHTEQNVDTQNSCSPNFCQKVLSGLVCSKIFGASSDNVQIQKRIGTICWRWVQNSVWSRCVTILAVQLVMKHFSFGNFLVTNKQFWGSESLISTGWCLALMASTSKRCCCTHQLRLLF